MKKRRNKAVVIDHGLFCAREKNCALCCNAPLLTGGALFFGLSQNDNK